MSATIQQAIKKISDQYKTAMGQYHKAIEKRLYKAASAWRQDFEMLELALAALREKLARENPEPLTIEELQQMHGEPVFIRKLDGDQSFWMLVYPDVVSNRLGWLDYRNYGRAWVAYRHKPKEVEK